MSRELSAKKTPIIICIAAIIVGFIAWIFMITNGLLTTTGMGNIFNWGLLIIVFAFLVGFGAGGQLVASLIVISKKEHLQPFAPIAQIIALGGAVGAAIAIMADLGNPFHILSMIIHPNIASPLTWDMLALTAFIVVSFICCIAIARKWNSLRVWMIVGFIAAIALQLVEGLLFALQGARAWWHSWVEPVDFLVVALVCGLTIMTLIAACSDKPKAKEASAEFAVGMFWAVIAHVVLSVLEVILLAVETTPGAEAAFGLLVAYIPLYLIEILVPLIAVFVLKFKLPDASKKLTVICSALVILGMFVHRFMLLYPALGGSTLFTSLSNQASPSWMYPTSTGFLASADQTFAMTQLYIPAFTEWVSILLPLGLAFLIAIVGYSLMVGGAERDVAQKD